MPAVFADVGEDAVVVAQQDVEGALEGVGRVVGQAVVAGQVGGDAAVDLGGPDDVVGDEEVEVAVVFEVEEGCA